MKRLSLPSIARTLALWMAIGMCVSVAVLAWFSYRAVREWQRTSAMLRTRSAADSADLLVTALARDMRAVQSSMLASPYWNEFILDVYGSYDVRGLVASAFARYPYPESFFAWRAGADPSALLFFNRADRPPAWMGPSAGPQRFPVTVGAEPVMAGRLINRILHDARSGLRYSIFEMPIQGIQYQIVTRLVYRDAAREHMQGVVGFITNLSWVGDNYFQEITDEVAQARGIPNGFALLVVDDHDHIVAASAPVPVRTRQNRRPFSLTFFDPFLLLDSPVDLLRREWAVEVETLPDDKLASATRGANRTVVAAALSAAVLALGLVLTARATRARAELAQLRSEFVSTVTHELKTPIATIRAVGDTLLSRRVPHTSLREYAMLVVGEAKRLTRLVDNLLAYARITDVTEAYSFEPLEPAVLIHELLARFRSQLADKGFEVNVVVPPDVPRVRADRVAMELLLDNVLDNAIRYSHKTPEITIGARTRNGRVAIEVTDRGVGIPADELPHVQRRFFRGHQAGSGGSGLGLAIANRIATDHAGTLTISSAVGIGTTVLVDIPSAVEYAETANSDR